MKPRNFLIFTTAILTLLLTACAQPNAPTPFLPAETAAASQTPAEASSPTLAVQTEPEQASSPTALIPPTQPETTNSGPNFASALSGCGEGSLYPEQDISVIAKTGHIQFINVYANW